MSNYLLGDTVARLTSARNLRLKSVDIHLCKLNTNLVSLLYKQGIIRGFSINPITIRVFLKYNNNIIVFYSIKLVSRPGKKIYWNLKKLSSNYKIYSFNFFYIISTNKGLICSNDCLLGKSISGKILLKIQV